MKINNTGTEAQHVFSDASLISDHLQLSPETIALLVEKRIRYMGYFYQLTVADLSQHFQQHKDAVKQMVKAAEEIGFPPGMRTRHPLAQAAFG